MLVQFSTTIQTPVQLTETGHNKTLILGFHGYGESASIMQRRIRQLQHSDALYCSPQALHPFYNKGKIGYNWMVSENRKIHIQQNLDYIFSLFQSLEKKYTITNVILIGFSQGVAMAWRFASYLTQKYDSPQLLITVGGDIPPDVSIQQIVAKHTVLARGTQDVIYSASQFQQDAQKLQEASFPFSQCNYQGEHQWNTELVHSLQQQLP